MYLYINIGCIGYRAMARIVLMEANPFLMPIYTFTLRILCNNQGRIINSCFAELEDGGWRYVFVLWPLRMHAYGMVWLKETSSDTGSQSMRSVSRR